MKLHIAGMMLPSADATCAAAKTLRPATCRATEHQHRALGHVLGEVGGRGRDALLLGMQLLAVALDLPGKARRARVDLPALLVRHRRPRRSSPGRGRPRTAWRSGFHPMVPAAPARRIRARDRQVRVVRGRAACARLSGGQQLVGAQFEQLIRHSFAYGTPSVLHERRASCFRLLPTDATTSDPPTRRSPAV